MTNHRRDMLWSAVNKTAQSVAGMRLLEFLLHGSDALIRDRCAPLLMQDGMFEHEALAAMRIPGHLGSEPAKIAHWIKNAKGNPNAAKLENHINRLALRTAKIDSLLSDFFGCIKQLVIVGAGLDTRAFNMSGTDDIAIFEVDFPHVLAFKAARLRGIPITFRERTEIGCDFTTEAFLELLSRSAFRSTEPTIWLIEGVLVYLTAAQIAGVNRTLQMLSAPGSRLIATFLGKNAPETFVDGMISRFDDSPRMLAEYGWQARQVHYADLAREYGRVYPADYDVYLTYTEPRL